MHLLISHRMTLLGTPSFHSYWGFHFFVLLGPLLDPHVLALFYSDCSWTPRQADPAFSLSLDYLSKISKSEGKRWMENSVKYMQHFLILLGVMKMLVLAENTAFSSLPWKTGVLLLGQYSINLILCQSVFPVTFTNVIRISKRITAVGGINCWRMEYPVL